MYRLLFMFCQGLPFVSTKDEKPDPTWICSASWETGLESHAMIHRTTHDGARRIAFCRGAARVRQPPSPRLRSPRLKSRMVQTPLAHNWSPLWMIREKYSSRVPTLFCCARPVQPCHFDEESLDSLTQHPTIYLSSFTRCYHAIWDK